MGLELETIQSYYGEGFRGKDNVSIIAYITNALSVFPFLYVSAACEGKARGNTERT